MSPSPKSNRHKDKWIYCCGVCLRDVASTKLDGFAWAAMRNVTVLCRHNQPLIVFLEKRVRSAHFQL
jgi:hypothetical protein